MRHIRSPNHNYWALLAQGKGVQLPVEFTPAEDGQGTLNSVPVELKHWHLKIGGALAEIWADAEKQSDGVCLSRAEGGVSKRTASP